MSACLFIASVVLWCVGILTTALAVAGSEMAERALPAIGRAWQVCWLSWIVAYSPVWLKAIVATAVLVTAVATMVTRRHDQR